jgi:hypothetical protein
LFIVCNFEICFQRNNKDAMRKTKVINENSLNNLKVYEKGQSGNPLGRPVGSRNRSTIARKWLDFEISRTNELTGETEKLTAEELITLAMIKKAAQGDSKAYQALMDSGFGKPIQATDITSNGESIKQVFKIGNQIIEI